MGFRQEIDEENEHKRQEKVMKQHDRDVIKDYCQKHNLDFNDPIDEDHSDSEVWGGPSKW